jgi:hypothetical protein
MRLAAHSMCLGKAARPRGRALCLRRPIITMCCLARKKGISRLESKLLLCPYHSLSKKVKEIIMLFLKRGAMTDKSNFFATRLHDEEALSYFTRQFSLTKTALSFDAHNLTKDIFKCKSANRCFVLLLLLYAPLFP